MAVVTFDDIRAGPPAHAWALNNTALKSIRDCGEDPPGYPNIAPGYGKELFDRDPFPIQTLQRTTGPAFELVDPEQPWSWRGMLNCFDDETLRRLVGPGITGICCMPLPGTYDHARLHAAVALGEVFDDFREEAPYEGERRKAPVPVWDFVVTRKDGTRIRFHPQLKNKKIGMADWLTPMERDGPTAGPGQSDGKGTFRRMQETNYPETGRANGRPAVPKANGRGRGGGHHDIPDRMPDLARMDVRGGGMADPTFAPNVPTKAAPPLRPAPLVAPTFPKTAPPPMGPTFAPNVPTKAAPPLQPAPLVAPTFPKKAPPPTVPKKAPPPTNPTAPPICPTDQGGDHRDRPLPPDHPPADNKRADVHMGGHVQDVRGGGHPAPDPPPAKQIPADAPPPPAPGLNLDDVPNSCGEHPGALALEELVDPIDGTPTQGATDELPRESPSWKEKLEAAEKRWQMMNDTQASLDQMD